MRNTPDQSEISPSPRPSPLKGQGVSPSVVFAALLCKEWHEQKVRLLLACIVMGLFTGGGYLQTDGRAWDVLWVVKMGIVIGAILLPIFIAMGLFAAERTARTFDTLAALPVGPAWIVLSKAALGAVCVVTPIVLCAAPFVVSAASDVREDLLRVVGFEIATGLIVLTWTAALGARQQTPTRVGLVGVAVVVGGYTAGGVIEMFYYSFHTTTVRHWMIAASYINPLALLGELLFDHHGSIDSTGASIAQLLIGIGLWGWCATRLRHPAVVARSAERRSAEHRKPIGRPVAWVWFSLLWREWRERWRPTVTIGGVVIGVPLAAAMTVFLTYWWQGHSHLHHYWIYPGYIITLTMTAAVPLAILLAVAATCYDLRPGLYGFWRSRPIRQSQWFVYRYVGGLGALASVLFVGIWLECTLPLQPQFPELEMRFMLVLLTALYSVSFFCGCLCRNTVPAALLSLAVCVALVSLQAPSAGAQWMSAVHVRSLCGPADALWPYVRFMFIYGAIIAAAVTLSWQALRRDWVWEIGT